MKCKTFIIEMFKIVLIWMQLLNQTICTFEIVWTFYIKIILDLNLIIIKVILLILPIKIIYTTGCNNHVYLLWLEDKISISQVYYSNATFEN